MKLRRWTFLIATLVIMLVSSPCQLKAQFSDAFNSAARSGIAHDVGAAGREARSAAGEVKATTHAPHGEPSAHVNAPHVSSGESRWVDGYGTSARTEPAHAVKSTTEGVEAASPEVKAAQRTSGDPLPRNTKNNRPIPDPEAAGIGHTQLGTRTKNGVSYRQSREFDAGGKAVKDVDHTDHGIPGKYTNPHEHVYQANGQRGPATPVNPKVRN